MKFNPMIKDFLRKVLENKDEKPVVRHEVILLINYLYLKNFSL